MKYNKISYLDKLKQLRDFYPMSSALMEALGISRNSLLNWLDRPESIKAENRFNIDVLYCKHFVVPEWDKPKQSFDAVLLPDDMPNNHHVFMPFLRRISYGTIEIERPIDQANFDKAIDAEKLPRNMSKKEFHEAWNTFVSIKGLWEKIIEHQEPFLISEESIKFLHNSFMRGVHPNAGFYSKDLRIMGTLENFDTTLPEDVPEEINRWVYKYNNISTLEDMAKAHAHFIAIHPFGDGNGRVGRALLMAQCLNARLMPPVFNSENRAIYFAAMEHALIHGRHAPLIRLFYEASTS